MIILVEGPDGAGKTTVCLRLLDAIPGSVLQHFGAPASKEEALNYFKVYAKLLRLCDKSKTIILDRCWYSDMVYGPVVRNSQEMIQEHADILAGMVVASGGGMVIYCTAKPQTLWSRCKRRGETYITDYAALCRIHDKYEEVMQNCVRYLPVIRYDTTRW